MRSTMWASLAVGLLLGVQGVSQAQSDTVRLGGPSAAADIQGGSDSELIRHGGGGHGGGYRGGYGYGGGYRGGYYGGYYGGYRGGYGYGSYYRPYYYGGYYRPYYYGGYYGSGYYGGGYASPYYNSYNYYTPSYYSYPISGVPAPVVTLQQTQAVYSAPSAQYPYLNQSQPQLAQAQYPYLNQPGTIQPPAITQNVQPMQPAGDGTFPYNGGPQQYVPTPQGNNNDAPAPMKTLPGFIPLDGKLVSMPSRTAGGTTPVSSPQGWTAVRTNINGNLSQTVPATTRIVYPAYGENIVPTPVKAIR